MKGMEGGERIRYSSNKPLYKQFEKILKLIHCIRRAFDQYVNFDALPVPFLNRIVKNTYYNCMAVSDQLLGAALKRNYSKWKYFFEYLKFWKIKQKYSMLYGSHLTNRTFTVECSDHSLPARKRINASQRNDLLNFFSAQSVPAFPYA